MPKLEAGMPTSKRLAKGFTLIEIMVVLMILGITMSLAVMAFGDFGETQRAESEAKRFKMKLELVQRHAMIENIPYRIDVNKNSYQIKTLSPAGTFVPCSEPKLGTYHFPNWLFVPKKVSILIQPSGETTPFTLPFQLRNNETAATVQLSRLGKLDVKK